MAKIQIKRGTAAIGTQLDTGEFGFKTDDKILAIGTGVGSAAERVSLWDEYSAHSILASVAADTPAAVTVDEQRVVGRKTGGNIAALTGTELWTILTGQAGADVSMNSKKITNLANPASAQDAATKDYVDSVATGLSVHEAVACATTENLESLSGEQTIDGVLTSESRVLVKNQSTASQNGIYVTASGSWSRAADMDSAAEVPHSFVFVSGGTTQKDTGWVCTNEPENIVLGTTAITFAQFSGAGYVSAGTGLSKTGNVISATGGLADIAGLSPTKGNVVVGNGTHWVALGVGTNDHVLTADSTQTAGVKWAAQASGVNTFVDLTDTPANYTGASFKVVRVNEGSEGNGTGLEFVSFKDTYLEDSPTENLQTKAPSSKWAYAHAAAVTGVHGAGANTLLHSGSTIDGGTLS